ncbi:MAG: hypothetical protein KatS3mg105_1623 [Gemmatales bacterium]|nr:MAG: hypothetical protein KatS3mg105_1623 [Gemmatales bacterium]
MAKQISQRERILLAVALVGAIAFGYLLRLTKGDIRKAKDLSKQIAAARDKLKQLKPPAYPTRLPGQIQHELQQVEKLMKAEETRLAELKAHFDSREWQELLAKQKAVDNTSPPDRHDEMLRVEQTVQEERSRIASIESRLLPKDNARELQGLKVRLSEWARENDVLVVENVPFTFKEATNKSRKPTAQVAGLLTPNAFYKAHPRPMQRLTLEASYANLSRFLAGLDKLPYEIVIVQFEIATDPKSAGGPLTANVVLAF